MFGVWIRALVSGPADCERLTMEAAMVFLNVVLALAAGASAVFAFVQAKAATDSRKEAQLAQGRAEQAEQETIRIAGEANAAFIRQAEAQEEANRIKREEMEPDDWSIVQTAKSSWRVSNTSKRTLTVADLIVFPESMKGFAHIETSHGDGVYEYGDSFTLTPIRYAGGGPEKLTIKYRRDHDSADDYRSFHISM